MDRIKNVIFKKNHSLDFCKVCGEESCETKTLVKTETSEFVCWLRDCELYEPVSQEVRKWLEYYK